MKVAGIDFSSNAIDVVLVDLDDQRPPEWNRFPLVGQDAFDRTRSIAQAMPARSSVLWDDVLAVGIEHPAGKFGTGAMMRVQGAVLAMLPVSVLVKAWPPGQWRKAVGLPGNATKEDVMEHALSQWWFDASDPWPQDACDAHCIALATRDAIETEAAA